MKTLIIIFISIMISCHSNMWAEESGRKTYVQEYCGYSIELPEAWKQVVDEKDTSVKDWSFTSGLHRYFPHPGRQPGVAEWFRFEKPESFLIIMMMKRSPGAGIGLKRIFDEFYYYFANNNGWMELGKGELKICDEKCYWRHWMLPDNLKVFQLVFLHKEYVYVTNFFVSELTREELKQIQEIMTTFTFLK